MVTLKCHNQWFAGLRFQSDNVLPITSLLCWTESWDCGRLTLLRSSWDALSHWLVSLFHGLVRITELTQRETSNQSPRLPNLGLWCFHLLLLLQHTLCFLVNVFVKVTFLMMIWLKRLMKTGSHIQMSCRGHMFDVQDKIKAFPQKVVSCPCFKKTKQNLGTGVNAYDILDFDSTQMKCYIQLALRTSDTMCWWCWWQGVNLLRSFTPQNSKGF